jgi:hypothetical protein
MEHNVHFPRARAAAAIMGQQDTSVGPSGFIGASASLTSGQARASAERRVLWVLYEHRVFETGSRKAIMLTTGAAVQHFDGAEAHQINSVGEAGERVSL